jgi:solute carrier family 35 protein C2
MVSADGRDVSDISRWLALLRPGDEFPLRTLPSLPSDSSLSDADSNGGGPVARPADAAQLIQPPTPTTMENEPAVQGHARRRSSSLAGASIPPTKPPRKHRKRPSDHIAEEDDENSSSAERSGSESLSDSTDYELDDMSGDGLEDDEETGLTKGDRRRRRRRKRRNTLLDQRVVPTNTYTKEEKKLADQNLAKSMLVNAALIGLWYDSYREQNRKQQLTHAGTSFRYQYPSTTSGCSRRRRVMASRRTSFRFRFSQRVCI